MENIKPDWPTGIYIGNGVIAEPKTSKTESDKIAIDLANTLKLTLSETKKDFHKVKREFEAVSLHLELLRSQIIILENTIKKAPDNI